MSPDQFQQLIDAIYFAVRSLNYLSATVAVGFGSLIIIIAWAKQ